MNYLLDTHTFLWFIDNDKSLSATAKAFIEAPDSAIFLSVASLWEIAIKVSLEKLDLPTPLTSFLNQQLKENSIEPLPIEVEHIGKIATLPFHHRDPFDRLIIAQSLSENWPIIGRDGIFDAYAVNRYW